MQSFTAKTVIVANGAFPTHATPLAALRSAREVVCCDGAADRLSEEAGLAPSWIVGDLDSLSETLRARFPERLVRVTEQETNDLAKAFRFCRTRGWSEMLIVGATGLREDHTLANLALLADFAREASVLLLTDTGWFTPLLASARLPSVPGQQISLFALDTRTSVSARGLAYPVDGLRLDRWWRAALNEAQGESFSLAIEGGPLLVYQTYVRGGTDA
jgi:thiamine pyrophosphokinase